MSLTKKLGIGVACAALAGLFAASPAQAATITPDGGTAGAYCHDLTVNGQPIDWEMYYSPVSHSIPVSLKNIGMTVYCKDPSWDNYDCIGAIDGLAFTLFGAGIELRAVIAAAGGLAVTLPGTWSAC
jgi:hypothetical protein